METSVISELVVTSTLLLPGDAEPETLPDGLLTFMCVPIPIISPFVVSSKESTDFSLFEEGRESESVRAPGDPDSVPLNGISYIAAGMFA